MPSQTKTISWQAPEFKHYEKSFGWYVVLFSVTVLFIGFFIFQKDLFAAVTMAILGVMVYFFSKHIPQIVNIELNSKGVKFGNILYPYKQLQHFWIVHNERHKTVNFQANILFNSVIILELAEQDPDEVREYILQFLPEHEQIHETGIQRIMHLLKF